MRKQEKGWLAIRGQHDAGAAIDHLVEVRPDERVLQIPDGRIDDSPAQVREPFSEASLEDLIGAMRSGGFSGALVVRAHPETSGRYQLLYGHRRRAAWRIVCHELGKECLLPVIVRTATDRDMLLLGATENLAREDLSLREECTLIARMLKEFFPASQDEVAQMLGKTRGWIAPRVRVNSLHSELRERLWHRQTAMSHILMLAELHRTQREVALSIADRIVAEDLPLAEVRALVDRYRTHHDSRVVDRDKHHNLIDDSQVVMNHTEQAYTTVRSHTRATGRPAEQVSDEPMLANGDSLSAHESKPLAQVSFSASECESLQRMLEMIDGAIAEIERLPPPRSHILHDALADLLNARGRISTFLTLTGGTKR